ncbi:MAG: hypothetical protein HY706_21475 [Candidatus Hydrogenedentes bacterium]|nr:hypothetical protein [Candidatus Hydrogenedentota bacterium]
MGNAEEGNYGGHVRDFYQSKVAINPAEEACEFQGGCHLSSPVAGQV